MKLLVILLSLALFSCKKKEEVPEAAVPRIVKHSDSLKTPIDKEFLLSEKHRELYRTEECKSSLGSISFSDSLVLLDSLMPPQYSDSVSLDLMINRTFEAYKIRTLSGDRSGWIKRGGNFPFSTGTRGIALKVHRDNSGTPVLERGDAVIIVESDGRRSTVVTPNSESFTVPAEVVSSDPLEYRFVSELTGVLGSDSLRSEVLRLCSRDEYADLPSARALKEKVLLHSAAKEELLFLYAAALREETDYTFSNTTPLSHFEDISSDVFVEFLDIGNVDKGIRLLSGAKYVMEPKGTFEGFRYNTDLLTWLANLLPAPDFSFSNGVTAQSLYNKHLSSPVRLMAMTLQELYKLDIAVEARSYYAAAEGEYRDPVEFLIVRYTGDRSLYEDEVKRYEECRSMSSTFRFGFWLRRTLDGTLSETASFLYTLLERYDSLWYSEQVTLPGVEELQFIETTDFAKGSDKPWIYYKSEEKLGDLKENIFAHLWLALPMIPNINDNGAYDVPNCGIYGFMSPILNMVPYSAIAKASGMEVFLKGPHSNDSLDLDAYSDEFGYYNPEFVKWITDKALPATENSAFRRMTQRYYDKYLKNSANLYRDTYYMGFLNGNFGSDYQVKAYLRACREGEGYGELFDTYRKVLSSDGEGDYDGEYEGEYGSEEDDYDEEEDSEKAESDEMLVGHAVMFWMRRTADGTAPLFYDAVMRLINTYEN